MKQFSNKHYQRNIYPILNWFAVFWIIISTGSLIICIFNMKLCMIVLDGIALLYLVFRFKCGKKQLAAGLLIIGLVALNCLLNIQYLSFNDDMIILLMRVFALIIICSNLRIRTFQTYFCKIVLGLCILSIPCFLLGELGIDLPGQTTIWFKDKYYIYTFYHTLGRWQLFHRNAGIFWESPAFAIFIITALLMLLFGQSDTSFKIKIKYFIIYSITLFTTLATTAYITYILAILAIVVERKKLFRNNKISPKHKKLLIIGFVLSLLALIAVFVYIESTTHVIQHKLIDQQGSFGTRANDTISGLTIASRRLLTGFGMFNNYTGTELLKLNVTDNSNWFSTTFMYFGIPLALIYYYFFFKGIKRHYSCSWISMILIFSIYFVFINTENIGTMTLFMYYLFPSKKENCLQDYHFILNKD